ncbi:MAG TPA: hypothetical protein VFV90_11820 [Usitatibacter sp.]|nr:hypothetical protein [Usitatibacter sp.]
MTAKRKVVVAAAAIHLALAAVYAVHVPAETVVPRHLDRAVAFYGSFSGVRNHFDFFAPSVSTQARADFRVFTADGAVRHVRLATPSAEANNRIALMLTYYSYPSTREMLLRAWGQYVLRLYPQAVAVESRIEALEIPTIGQAAAGAKPRWLELGRLTVRKDDDPAR